jgi:alpha-beta hydrolase superfamily lysophospholipase
VLGVVDPERPLVVVSHSLGTVVAYEALHEYEGAVPVWVTLGSPLALGAVVLDRLVPRPASCPANVASWLNFWDRDDIVVGRPHLANWIQPSKSGVKAVTERVTSRGLWTHTATKYLEHGTVARPVIEALRS